MRQQYEPLEEGSALGYFAQLCTERRGFRDRFFSPSDSLKCQDLADGNVNLVFRISNGSGRSVLLKQALPHARRYPDFKMPLERARIEADILKIYNEHCAGLAPELYFFDPVMFVILMEDLSSHIIMREGLMTQVVYESFPSQIGRFLARSLFFTSDFWLKSEDKKSNVARFINPVLCKVTEDLVFTFPFAPHETNRYPVGISYLVNTLHSDTLALGRVAELKQRFMSDTSALIHGDLHTGSIMVNANETRVIDPEFGFYGPMGFDIGNILGNLLISWAVQDFYCSDKVRREAYRDWLIHAYLATWKSFEVEFRSLLLGSAKEEFRNEACAKRYLNQVLSDSFGFAACEMIRRTIGMAHVPELDGIDDDRACCEASERILKIATHLLHEEPKSIESSLECLQ